MSSDRGEHGHQHENHAEHDPNPSHHEHDPEHHHQPHQAAPGLIARLRHLVVPHSHDHASSVDSALEADARGVRALKVSLVALGITALAQGVVVVFTNSVALLSDTLHNGADALTALPIWLAFSLAARPASRRFPYGYGRAEDLAGLVVLLFIAGSALFALYESFQRLMSPAPVSWLGAVAVAGVIGFVGNEAVARYRMRVGREIGSTALVADGLHARTDGFTSLGVVAGAVGVALGFPLADPLAGLVIAALIALVLRDAARDVLLRILDAVDPAILDEAREVLDESDGVVGVGAVRVRWIGHRLHAEAEVTVDESLSIAAAHEVAENARHRLLHEVPHLASALIHADPCGHGGADAHATLAHHAG